MLQHRAREKQLELLLQHSCAWGISTRQARVVGYGVYDWARHRTTGLRSRRAYRYLFGMLVTWQLGRINCKALVAAPTAHLRLHVTRRAADGNCREWLAFRLQQQCFLVGQGSRRETQQSPWKNPESLPTRTGFHKVHRITVPGPRLMHVHSTIHV